MFQSSKTAKRINSRLKDYKQIDNMLDPKNFIGRCPEQVVRYCGEGGEVQKALAKYKKHIEGAKAVELTV